MYLFRHQVKQGVVGYWCQEWMMAHQRSKHTICEAQKGPQDVGTDSALIPGATTLVQMQLFQIEK